MLRFQSVVTLSLLNKIKFYNHNAVSVCVCAFFFHRTEQVECSMCPMWFFTNINIWRGLISGEFRTWTSYILTELFYLQFSFFFRRMNGECIPTLVHHRRTSFFGSFFQVRDYFSYFFSCVPLQETNGVKTPILTQRCLFSQQETAAVLNIHYNITCL